MRVCIVQGAAYGVTETFIAAHAKFLRDVSCVVHSPWNPKIGDEFVLSQGLVARGLRRLERFARRRGWEWECTKAFMKAIKTSRADVVLAEYGPNGVAVMEACERVGVPLVVHFHGYDASVTDVLEEHKETYRKLFRSCAGIVGVSQAMCRTLTALGAPADKLYFNPCGVDCHFFSDASPETAPRVLAAVGRFVEKKAPHLTIAAFARVARVMPDSRLRMIGEGPLLGVCRQLANGLGVGDKVEFLGAKPPAVVREVLRGARAFVQHSIVASSGDSEGTPVAVLEASACGLPVVATRHAGIPDVVLHHVTGLLVDEKDVDGMAEHMMAVLSNPAFAGQLGRNGRARALQYFTMEKRIGALQTILERACRRERACEVFSLENDEMRLSRENGTAQEGNMRVEFGTRCG